MKTVIIAVLLLLSFAGEFAQTSPVKKDELLKIQVANKATNKLEQTKATTLMKGTEGSVTFDSGTAIFAAVCFALLFAAAFYATTSVAQWIAGFVALFIAGRKKLPAPAAG
jgi:hypothetical protein